MPYLNMMVFWHVYFHAQQQKLLMVPYAKIYRCPRALIDDSMKTAFPLIAIRWQLKQYVEHTRRLFIAIIKCNPAIQLISY